MQSVLTSWKEIGQYVGKGTRTVQRWEAQADFPVRRMNLEASKSSVFAIPAEVDEWIN
jgi:predicted DNA-binding transcriptional regulator AlpA